MAKASLFDGSSWTSEELGPDDGGSHASVGARGHIAAWLYQKSVYASRYNLKQGWADPIKLGATSAETFGPGAGWTIRATR